jgi:hypothetical protein
VANRAIRAVRRRPAARQLPPARKAYILIRDNLGRPELDAETHRRIDEYATEVLGGTQFAGWLRTYTIFRQRFIEGWMPENFFAIKVTPQIIGDGKLLGRRRTVARRWLGTDLIPDLAYRINGWWFDAEYRPVPRDRLAETVFADVGEVYVKDEGLWQGLAVHRVGRDGFDAAVAALQNDAVIQRPVLQHPFFDQIHPASVATLRVVTSFLDEEGPRHHGTRLRLATGDDRWVKSQSQIAVNVIDDVGTLSDEGHDRQWNPHHRHPDTGFPFEGERIPHFADAVAECLDLHGKLPHQALLGWDLTITPDGKPSILEVNSGRIGISHFEATVGPIFLGCGFERFA